MLKEIAPTVYLPYFEMTMEERLTSLGNILNREGEAKALLDNFYGKVEASKAKLKEAGILDKQLDFIKASLLAAP